MTVSPVRLTPQFTPVPSGPAAGEITALLRERDHLLQLHEALADVARAVSASLRLDDVLPLIARHAAALLHADGAAVMLHRGDHLDLVAATGSAAPLAGQALPLYGSISGRAFREQMGIISNDAAGDPELYPMSRVLADVTKVVIAPLASATGTIGVLAVVNRTEDFNEDDAIVLERLGNQVAVAVDNARLYEETEALAERYRRVVETTGDAILMLDGDRRIVFANQAAETLFGPSGTVVGRPMGGFIPSDQQERIAEFDARTLFGMSQRYETTLLRADGGRRFVSVGTAPLREGGTVTGIVASLRDVTEERERALALERSEARYTRLVETASDAIFTVDTHGGLTSVNRSLERSTGRSRGELLGRSFVALLDERDRVLGMRMLSDSFDGKRKRVELRYPSGTGESRTCSLTLTPLVEGGEVTGALGIVRDVTDERRLGEQLLQQEKLAAVGQLVSGVAHELNNPLAGVMAFAQLLLASPQPYAPDQRRAIETIDHEARRAAKIVSNLLTFARQRAPERSATDVNRVIGDTVDLRRDAFRAAGVEVRLELDRHLPITWADPFQLQQVLLNLLTNAEHALADTAGPRRITVVTEHAAGHLCIRVSDTGSGIATENLPRIFNPFFTTKRVGDGTGLGLSISDGIVREHGGRIRAESPPGCGATFVVELPYTPPPGASLVAGAEAGPSVVGAWRILVVDDEPALRSVLAIYFRSLGHMVETAATGSDAIRLAGSEPFDAVLLDVRLPDLSGEAVLAEIRRVNPVLAERVVFLTGDTQSESTRGMLDSTGRPVVSKPFLLDELAVVVLGMVSGVSPVARPAL